MSKREDTVLLKDIIESGDKIFRYTLVDIPNFMVIMDAVIETEIIGKAQIRYQKV
ncbi:MAG: hypothetical protein IPQ11_13475 [Bacteroidetes bacterium]|nr:hypothetical protein [Bacteroidota bacterium]